MAAGVEVTRGQGGGRVARGLRGDGRPAEATQVGGTDGDSVAGAAGRSRPTKDLGEPDRKGSGSIR